MRHMWRDRRDRPAPHAGMPGMAGGRLCRRLLVGAALTMTLAGCGGAPRPSGYNCVNGSGGGYSQLTLSHAHTDPRTGAPDLTADPISVGVAMNVVPLSCDAACQASSGDTTRPGYIGNFLVMYDGATGDYIRVGYMSYVAHAHYVLQYQLHDVGGGTPVTRLLARTNVDPGFSGSYPLVYFRNGTDTLAPGGYAEGAIQGSDGSVVDTGGALTTMFHPTFILLVQLIWGHSGASAPFAPVTLIQYATTITISVCGTPPTLCFMEDWRYLSQDGALPGPGGTADVPSYAGWYVRPSSSSGGRFGGIYYMGCCDAPTT